MQIWDPEQVLPGFLTHFFVSLVIFVWVKSTKFLVNRLEFSFTSYKYKIIYNFVIFLAT
jgi:hypothetical protein